MKDALGHGSNAGNGNPEPYRAGQKVLVGGKLGEISHVHNSQQEGFPHSYRITDLSAKDPYAQTRLEGGNYIPHDRVQPVGDGEAHTKAISDAHHATPPMTPDRVIRTGRQFGQKIGGREARAISALLRGRH